MKTSSFKQKIRQIFKTLFLFFFLSLLFFPNNNFAQENNKVDYSKKSNILNPDTLLGDQKIIFWHFVKLTHEEAKALTPVQIKAEFEKLGIFTSERARFVAAYSFLRIEMEGHKKSCENWAYFEFLNP